MLSKILDVGFYHDCWTKVKELFKDFKFTKLELKPGNEMLRTSWFGRHDFVPYVRLDLWRVGYRISYDPDYYRRFTVEYSNRLSEDQHKKVMEYVDYRMEHDQMEERIQVVRRQAVVKEHPTLWRDVCHYVEDRDWV